MGSGNGTVAAFPPHTPPDRIRRPGAGTGGRVADPLVHSAYQAALGDAC